MNYAKQLVAVEFREWDLQTVSAADYTIEIELSKKQIENIKKHHMQKIFSEEVSPAMRNKLIIAREIEV